MGPPFHGKLDASAQGCRLLVGSRDPCRTCWARERKDWVYGEGLLNYEDVSHEIVKYDTLKILRQLYIYVHIYMYKYIKRGLGN